ncbi:MAG: MarR family transcriptional regulator [Thermoflexales bacterium]|nr:MarR family transcriptional regulator [Thermoflexales bacterium]
MENTLDRFTTARRVIEFFTEGAPPFLHALAAKLREAGYDDTTLVHLRLLSLLSDGACNLSELANKQAVSLPTMSNSISVLVERGWVKRSQSSTDRRMVCLELTPAGRSVLMQAMHHTHVHVAELLAPLSPREQEAVTAGLAVLQKVFQAESR